MSYQIENLNSSHNLIENTHPLFVALSNRSVNSSNVVSPVNNPQINFPIEPQYEFKVLNHNPNHPHLTVATKRGVYSPLTHSNSVSYVSAVSPMTNINNGPPNSYQNSLKQDGVTESSFNQVPNSDPSINIELQDKSSIIKRSLELQTSDKPSDPTPDQTKTKTSCCHNFRVKCVPSRCILPFAIIYISILACILSILVVSSRNKNNIRSFTGILQSISINMNSPPIQNLVFVPATATCPENYQLMSIGSWPGTADGCYCPSVNSLRTGSCQSNEISKGCSTMKAQRAQELYIWKGNHICVLYTSQYDFVASCPEDYLKCYDGGCFPKKNGCPMTNFTIQNGVLTTSSDGISQPLVGLKVSMNGLPCLDPATAPAAPLYPLIQGPLPSGCVATDPASNFTVDEYPEYNLLLDNKLNSRVSSLPNYIDFLVNVSAELIGQQRYALKNSEFCMNFPVGCFDDVNYSISHYFNDMVMMSALSCSMVALMIISFVMLMPCLNKIENCCTCWSNGLLLILVLAHGSLIGLASSMIAETIDCQAKVDKCNAVISNFLISDCFVAISIPQAITDHKEVWISSSNDLLNLSIVYLIFAVICLPFVLRYTCFYKTKEKYIEMEEEST